MEVTGCDGAEAVSDLLADLMHWCDERGVSFDVELAGARYNYTEEVKYPEVV